MEDDIEVLQNPHRLSDLIDQLDLLVGSDGWDILFTDRDIKLHFAFERFLENQIRASFGFKGTPIWFKIKARNEKKKD